VKWLQALHGGKVLSERSYREMTSPSHLNDNTPLRYGMGLSVGPDVRGAMLIGHGGAIGGFTSDVSWYPIPWIDGWRFGRNGATFMTFERTGSTGPASVLRYDGGGGYYILKRVQQN
jgi:hypothetical protein